MPHVWQQSVTLMLAEYAAVFFGAGLGGLLGLLLVQFATTPWPK